MFFFLLFCLPLSVLPKPAESEIWKDKVGEIIEIEIDGTEKSHTIIYTVKYPDNNSVPCFRENDLELVK